MIEHNLFVNAASDPETISVKSSDNIIRYNTMRPDHRAVHPPPRQPHPVYGNYILGDGQAAPPGCASTAATTGSSTTTSPG